MTHDEMQAFIAKSVESIVKQNIGDGPTNVEEVRIAVEKSVQTLFPNPDVEVICDAFNNSDEDIAARRLNMTVIFWPTIAGGQLR